MPKLITTRRVENEIDLARKYAKTHILFPSALLGALFMLVGTATLIYQFAVETYNWKTFAESTGLLLLGGLLGWVQTRYHRYVLREDPGYFAGRLRTFSKTGPKRSKKEPPVQPVEHAGSRLVPILYVAGIALLLGVSSACAMAGDVDYMAAFLMPWGGFFWSKMFFWRGVLIPDKS